MHADLDSFYASVEQRDDPSLRDKPIAVGGGVVLAASYEAKAFGVRTAMSGGTARRLCPNLIEVSPRFGAYTEASKRVFEIFHDTSPIVEAMSIDEAFIDVAGLWRIAGTPTEIATALRRRVADDVGLPISVGVARTKFLAKVASAVSKPNGLLVVEPDGELDFLHPLPVQRLWGVGNVTATKLHERGLHTVADVASMSPEALVAIDVNSGSTSKGKNFEETIFQANMEAAKELARQLRLRDLGGLVVVDFIDMRNSKHVREVERQVKTAMKRDKAKVDISRISRFGLMQISRQKMGSPIESGNYKVCEHCRGRGTVRSVETQALFYFRRIHAGASRRQVTQISCRFPLDVAEYLLNNKRYELIELEEKYQTRVVVTADPSLKPSEHEITFHKAEKEEPPQKQA